MKRILVVGAGGQIGTELVPHLQKNYGQDNVIAADLRPEIVAKLQEKSIAISLDAVKDYKVDAIFNLVALLSATGEKNPQLAWNINMGALLNSLNIAKEFNCAVFTPSSIGAFGENTPHHMTPQDTVMRPNTIYGVCKVSGELLSDYYYTKFGVDTRSVRFPGIISNGAMPGGGTTVYAVEVFYHAVKPANIPVMFQRIPIWICYICLMPWKRQPNLWRQTQPNSYTGTALTLPQ